MAMLASRLLRVALVVLLLGTVLAQVLLPVFASEEGTIFPEVAYLVVPYSVAGILAIACVQVALLVVLAVILSRPKRSVAYLANAVCIPPAIVAFLKNVRARAIRFTTLD